MKARISPALSILSIAAALTLGPLSASAETPMPAASSAAGEGHAGGGMPMGIMGKGDHSEMGCGMMDEDMEHMSEHMKSMMQDMMSCKMMGGHMQKMRSMMRDMMSMMVSHVDERLASLKTDLKITDAQLAQWNGFADALRSAAKSMETMRHEMAQSAAVKRAPVYGGEISYPDAGAIKKIGGPAPEEGAMQSEATEAGASGSLPARLEGHEKRLTEHLASLKAIKAALDPLYASFSDEQKKVADGLLVGPMGVM